MKKKVFETMSAIMLPTEPNDETGKGATAIFFDYSRDWGHLYILSKAELQKGDWFIWQSGMTGDRELHQFHSDAGYGIKTYTEYDPKNESSLIVNWSGRLGKVEAATDPLVSEFHIQKRSQISKLFLKEFIDSKGTLVDIQVEVTRNTKGDIIDGGSRYWAKPNADNEVVIAKETSLPDQSYTAQLKALRDRTTEDLKNMIDSNKTLETKTHTLLKKDGEYCIIPKNQSWKTYLLSSDHYTTDFLCKIADSLKTNNI